MKPDITTSNLGEALTLIDVAITLGAELPAPNGCFFYMATSTTVSSKSVIGYYTTQEEAEKNIRARIMRERENSFTGPWVNDLVRNLKFDKTPAGQARTLLEYNRLKDAYFEENDVEVFFASYLPLHKYVVKKIFIGAQV